MIGTGCRREPAGVDGLGPHMPVSDDSVALCAADPVDDASSQVCRGAGRVVEVTPAAMESRVSLTMSSARDWSPSKSVARRTIGAHATAYSRSIAWSTLWSLTVTILMQ